MYELTYTVKDKAGNKATKKRYVTVVDSTKNTTEKVTTESRTTEKVTTEKVTTQEKTTEKVTTGQQTTEKPTVEKPTMPDMSEYGTMESVTVNGIKYNILKVTDEQKYSDEIKQSKYEGEFSSDKILAYQIGFDKSICDYSKNHKYLEFFGNIKAIDKYGVDCSDTIFIIEHYGSNWFYFYYVDSKGKFKAMFICTLHDYDHYREIYYNNYNYIDYENRICINGDIFSEEFL